MKSAPSNHMLRARLNRDLTDNSYGVVGGDAGVPAVFQAAMGTVIGFVLPIETLGAPSS